MQWELGCSAMATCRLETLRLGSCSAHEAIHISSHRETLKAWSFLGSHWYPYVTVR